MLIKNKFALISLIAVILFNISLTSFPLLNLLHYESSSLNAVLISFIAGIFWLNKNEKMGSRSIAFYYLLVILIPAAILAFSTLFCANCPVDDGIWFYLLISLPAIPVGISIAAFSTFISGKFKYVVFILTWLIVLFGFLTELYFNPQIFFFNPIFGYFPGVIYDHSIEISRELIIYRISNIIIAILIISLFSLRNSFKLITKLIIITALISTYIRSDAIKEELNLSTDKSRIQTELKQRIETAHFEIILPDSLDENQMKIVNYEHEYYYEKIEQLLNDAPAEKITSFIFESGVQKKRLFGSGNADVAKPWLNQIYLNYNNYNSSLKHEISHIFSAKYGKTPFHIPPNLNPGLIEGFAMAVENDYDGKDIYYLAALAYKNDYRISLESLFVNLSFFSSASSLSYLYAGSFIRYLADLYGWDSIKRLYAGEDFISLFGLDLSELEKEFYKKIENIDISENSNHANYYFGYRPLVQLTCARATAKELRNAGELLSKKEYQSAAEEYMKIYKYSQSYAALVGYASALKEIEDYSKAISIIEEEIEKYNGSSSYYYLEFVLGDLYALNSDSVNADFYYSRLIEQDPHEIYTRNAFVKRIFLNKGIAEIKDYLNFFDNRTKMIRNTLALNPSNELFIQLIKYSDAEPENFNEILNLIKSLNNEIVYSQELLYTLAEFCYLNLEFDLAYYYSEKALTLSSYSRQSSIKEFSDKMKWILSKY